MSKWLLVSFLSFALMGCGSKGVEQPTIVGNWLLVSVSGVSQAENSSYFEIYAATTYQQVNVVPRRNVAVTGTYTLQGSTLNQIQNGGANLSYQVDELSASRLVVRSTRGVVYEYRKVTDAEREAIFNRN